MKKLKSLGLILIAIFSIITFAGCFDTVQFELSFVVDNEIYYAIKTDGKSTIAMPDNPEKAGYTFDGWYWDENVWQQPFTANSLLNQPLQKDMSVYAKWQVEIPPVEVSSVIFDSSTLAIVVGGQATITATVLPEIATNKTLTWTSSNPAVAIVDNGVVSAIGEGKATITATSSNNLNTTCEVTVVSENQVAVNVYIDGEKVNTIYTSYENNFKITDLEKPEDITTNPNAEKYFYGWFVDSNFQTPLTDNTTFALGGNIYGKWINVYSNDFAYTVSKGKATINSFTNTNNSTVVVVPCYLNSFPVERISSSAFANQTMLRNVIICNGIQYIDDNVFYGCNSMATIELSNTLKEIGTSAFEDCELLTEISLPNTLTKINANAFKNCSSLTKVNFGSANWWVTSDENYVFENYVQSSDNTAVVQQLTQTYSNKIWTNYTLFNVIYQLDDGTLPNNATRYFCEHTATFELATPNKKGYDFDGYYQNSNLIDENINQIEKGTKHNIIVYAKYTLINYTITYILNGGTNNENNLSTYNIEMDNLLLYNATKNYYDFVSWTLNNQEITTINTSLCQNITLVANFTPIVYTISYVLNGGTNSENNPATYTVETPTITLSPAIFENETVSRWYFEESFDNRIISIPKGSHENITLYARAGYDVYDTVIINNNNTVTSANKSFLNEFSITRIIVPDSVQSINGGAFSDCGNLTHITLPFVGGSKKSSIDTYQYPFGYIFGTNSYTGGISTSQVYYGSSTSSTTSTTYYIPISLKSVTITSGDILYGAFYNCTSLSSITIPNIVTSIGNCAFYKCSSLTNITIPESVTNIGDSAFSYCSSLTRVDYIGNIEDWCKISFNSFDSNPLEYAHKLYISNKLVDNIEISNTITELKNFAFNGMNCLQNITIPNSVTSIGNSAFSGCSSLTKVITSSLEDWLKITFYSNDSNPLYYAGHLYIGEDEVTELIIPNTITEINKYAFSGCKSLTNITIPNSIASIDSSAFNGCSKLKNLTIGKIIENKTIRSIISIYSQLENITLLDGVTSFGDSAFSGCSSLTSIKIPSSVTSIGYGAFSDCSSLTKVITSSLEDWLKITFYSNDSNPLYYARHLYIGDNEITELVIPNTITKINSYTFYNCISLTSVKIPNSVTSIGSYAFCSCRSVVSIEIPNSVTSIGNYAFSGCSSLTSIKISSSITSIGYYAFSYCSSLTKVITSSLEDWLKITFYSNDSNPLYYARHLYIGDNEVTELIIPNTITEINKYAFYNCSSLTSIEIPNSVTSIGYEAFCNCSSLTKVITSSLEDWLNITFYSYDSNPLYYARHLYIGDNEVTELIIPNTITQINKYAFYYCNSLTNITIPNSVTSVGNYAFSGCNKLHYNIKNNIKYLGNENNPYMVAVSVIDMTLSTYTLDGNVRVICNSAFFGCRSLTNITIPNSVISIGDSAFLECVNLKNLTIGKIIENNKLSSIISICSQLKNITILDGVTSIGNDTFSGCSSLTSITIPSSVTSIGQGAFSDCKSLTSVTFKNPNGWSAGSTTLSSSYLSNKSTAANYLINTYSDCDWTRQD